MVRARVDWDSGGAAKNWDSPPGPRSGDREGDPVRGGLCVRRQGFFVPLFQGGVSMTNSASNKTLPCGLPCKRPRTTAALPATKTLPASG